MEKSKVSAIREGEEIFLSYKEDNEQVISGYFILLNISETLLQVKSNQNIIAIPIHRVLKLKQRCSQ